jgi:hypothetical protein
VPEPEITLIIIYGVNKPLHDVKQTEAIEAVKLGAMGLFGIAASEQGQYVLKAKIDGTDTQLDEAKTVEFYRLHDEQKVTLAAGTPYGEA